MEWSSLRHYDALNQWKIDSEYIEFDKINIFIGSNNSGKSRLLRLLFELISHHYINVLNSYEIKFGDITTKSKIDRNDFIENLQTKSSIFITDEELKKIKTSVRHAAGLYGVSELLTLHNSIEYIAVPCNHIRHRGIVSFDDYIFEHLGLKALRGKFFDSDRHIDIYMSHMIMEINSRHDELLDEKYRKFNPPYYIPIQRGLKPFLYSDEVVAIFNKADRKYDEARIDCKDYYTRRVIDEYFESSKKIKIEKYPPFF